MNELTEAPIQVTEQPKEGIKKSIPEQFNEVKDKLSTVIIRGKNAIMEKVATFPQIDWSGPLTELDEITRETAGLTRETEKTLGISVENNSDRDIKETTTEAATSSTNHFLPSSDQQKLMETRKPEPLQQSRTETNNRLTELVESDIIPIVDLIERSKNYEELPRATIIGEQVIASGKDLLERSQQSKMQYKHAKLALGHEYGNMLVLDAATGQIRPSNQEPIMGEETSISGKLLEAAEKKAIDLGENVIMAMHNHPYFSRDGALEFRVNKFLKRLGATSPDGFRRQVTFTEYSMPSEDDVVATSSRKLPELIVCKRRWFLLLPSKDTVTINRIEGKSYPKQTQKKLQDIPVNLITEDDVDSVHGLQNIEDMCRIAKMGLYVGKWDAGLPSIPDQLLLKRYA